MKREFRKIMAKILLTHPKEMREVKFGSQAFDALSELGPVEINEGSEPFSTEELIEAASDCAIILADRLTAGCARLFESAPHVVAFVRNAVDIRNIDLDSASRNDVLVTHAGPHFTDSVVELVLAQMVNLARDLPQYAATYKEDAVPVASMGMQLSGKTAGIIGVGRIGTRLASVLRMLGLRVIATDPCSDFGVLDIEEYGLDDLLSESDFVICLAAHTAATTGIANTEFFRNMRPTSYFVNVSRGALVNERDLANALSDGVIAGAALDVGEGPDDMPPIELGRLPNVIASPHVGGLVPENILGQALDSVAQVRDILIGNVPDFALNESATSRWRSLSQ